MQSCLSSYAMSWRVCVTTTPRGDLADVEGSLSSALGAGAVFTAPDELEAYAADAYWPALAAKAAGTPLARPDAVVRPRTEEEVAAVLELEDELNARGLMLPHYPASVEWATVGGYIAARGSGVLSTRYGKIEDLVLTLSVATPATGLISTVSVPRHAVGPELTQLFVGSEGTLGVITRATLQLAPLPAERRFAAVAFPSVGAGVEAIRRTLQLGHRPSVVRMYDEDATRLAFAPVVGEDLSGVYTVLAFEGDSEAVEVEERRT